MNPELPRMTAAMYTDGIPLGATEAESAYTKIDEAYSEDYPLNLEAGAAFWHMCDLIWVMIFPTLYLM